MLLKNVLALRMCSFRMWHIPKHQSANYTQQRVGNIDTMHQMVISYHWHYHIAGT